MTVLIVADNGDLYLLHLIASGDVITKLSLVRTGANANIASSILVLQLTRATILGKMIQIQRQTYLKIIVDYYFVLAGDSCS